MVKYAYRSMQVIMNKRLILAYSKTKKTNKHVLSKHFLSV